MYSYTYPTTKTTSISSLDTGVWGIVALVIALCAAIVVYFVFMRKDNEKNLKGFTKNLYDFLHFKKFFIVDFVKIAYMFVAIYITLVSFGLISTSFIAFLLVLLFGNIIARIAFEAFMVMYSIFENTNEINKKMK